MSAHDQAGDQGSAMARLDAWIVDVCRALDLDPALVDREAVLDLAGDAAHAVLRPAAPVTTFVVGLAVGEAVALGEDPAAAFARALEQVAAALPSGAADD